MTRPETAAAERASPWTLALLWGLYFVQGIPFGFQGTAIPVLIREAGGSLTAVGLSGALALPWLFKPLLAPFVDRHHRRGWGRRRSWLLPLQAGLTLAIVATATSVGALLPMLAMVLVMNAFAAALDVAVDGLAVDRLREEDLGRGNVAQVVGYKLGMLGGGGLVLWGSERLGRLTSPKAGLELALLGVAALAAAVFIATLFYREPPPPAQAEAPPTMGAIVAALRRAMAAPGSGWLLAAIATYKLGETMADAMFKPFVLDAGFSRGDVGLWVATYGGAFSMVGSVLGGYLASHLARRRPQGYVGAVALTALVRVGPLLAQWWLATVTPSAEAIIAITCAEHLAGGALTTAMFALMMSRVDPRIGASHFTFFALVELLGKVPSGWLSGIVADHLGYEVVFAFAALASVAYLGVLRPLAARRHQPQR